MFIKEFNLQTGNPLSYDRRNMAFYCVGFKHTGLQTMKNFELTDAT